MLSNRRSSRVAEVVIACILAVALLAVIPSAADGQGVAPTVRISEVVSANDALLDAYGESPDWFELRNDAPTPTSLNGWSIRDGDGNGWALPDRTLDPGEHILIWASGRDETDPEWHTNFSIKSTGETLVLADDAGTTVDELAVPALADGAAYGRTGDGIAAFLAVATPGAANAAALPGAARLITEPQTFTGSIDVVLAADLGPGETLRYTLDGADVSSASSAYAGPVTITESTVVRAAIVAGDLVGPETSGGFVAVANSIVDFSSDLPIMLVHSTGVVGDEMQNAIVTLIEPGADGRSTVFEPPSWNGFAGLRIRGASSANFAKKQYKFEIWGDTIGTEIDADFFGFGADGDWVLYAPGRFDRAMINNAFMYELGHRLDVAAPQARFVEVFVEDNPSATVGSGDYLGLYLLREDIEIDDERLDLVEHTDVSAGDEGGYIVRYDWTDTCCTNLEDHPQFGSKIAVDSPGADDLTPIQEAWISTYWNDLQAAAKDSFSAVDPLVDVDNLIDGWLLAMLAYDVDVLRASHYMHLDAGGELRAGPLWDFDRSLGGADSRNDELTETESWTRGAGHSFESDIYADLWELPEVQALLRARWAELRAAELSDAALAQLVTDMGGEIAEAYTREITVWNDGGNEYGPRFGNGLQGELDYMVSWMGARTSWLDAQLLASGDAVSITDPGPISISENEDLDVALDVALDDADEDLSFVFTSTGLPEGLSLDPVSGRITGLVAYGDGGTYAPEVTVTTSEGAAATIALSLVVDASLVGAPALLLNEYNAVEPGAVLAEDGSDPAFGQAAGNGGDWFEIVTLEDHLDLRGWSFDPWSRTDTGSLIQRARLTLGDDPLLADVRAGSIITVAESVADDLTYDPANGDWTINLQATTSQAGAAFANQTDFDTNHRDWRLIVRDAGGAVRALVVGETAPWRDVHAGVAAQEVLALAADPSASVDPVQDWVDATQSSFGAPNTIAGITQDFSALRPDVVERGDVDCDGSAGVLDALVIAQYAVQLRTAVDSCPRPDPETQIVLGGADADRDGSITILDAFVVAQCAVGIDNIHCQNLPQN